MELKVSALEPGERFGRLTVVKRCQSKRAGANDYLTECDCGFTERQNRSRLISGRITACYRCRYSGSNR